MLSVFIIAVAALGMTATLSGCKEDDDWAIRDYTSNEGSDNGDNSSDEPDAGHRPGSGEGSQDPDDKDDNGADDGEGSGDIVPESPHDDYELIAGKWYRTDQKEMLEFTIDKQYAAYTSTGGEWTLKAQGNYNYSEFDRHLWIFVTKENETRLIEYKCIRKEDEMTLYPMFDEGCYIYTRSSF